MRSGCEGGWDWETTHREQMSVSGHVRQWNRIPWIGGGVGVGEGRVGGKHSSHMMRGLSHVGSGGGREVDGREVDGREVEGGRGWVEKEWLEWRDGMREEKQEEQASISAQMVHL